MAAFEKATAWPVLTLGTPKEKALSYPYERERMAEIFLLLPHLCLLLLRTTASLPGLPVLPPPFLTIQCHVDLLECHTVRQSGKNSRFAR